MEIQRRIKWKYFQYSVNILNIRSNWRIQELLLMQILSRANLRRCLFFELGLGRGLSYRLVVVFVSRKALGSTLISLVSNEFT